MKRVPYSIDGYAKRRGFIYFVQMLNEDGFIKIGFSNNVKKRIGSLQVGMPYELEVVVILDAYSEIEGIVHDFFIERWIRGEWFAPCRDMDNYINILRNDPAARDMYNAIYIVDRKLMDWRDKIPKPKKMIKRLFP